MPPRLVALALLPVAVHAYESGAPETAAVSRYTFAWPIGEGMPKPRGSSTKGAAVALDTEPAEEWKRLHAPGLSNFERDRRAILAMAGPYRVSFDFLEVARFDPALKPDTPTRAGEPSMFSSARIAKFHRLTTRSGDAGATGRQRGRAVRDPSLAPGMALSGRCRWCIGIECLGPQTNPEDQRGAWVQSVYQVDDSPRYAAGPLAASDSFSTWISDETWRPLPRREWSVRNDYQVLVEPIATITPTGWMQEKTI